MYQRRPSPRVITSSQVLCGDWFTDTKTVNHRLDSIPHDITKQPAGRMHQTNELLGAWASYRTRPENHYPTTNHLFPAKNPCDMVVALRNKPGESCPRSLVSSWVIKKKNENKRLAPFVPFHHCKQPKWQKVGPVRGSTLATLVSFIGA